MKKIILVVGVLFVLIIGAMIAIPFLFKDEIKQVVKNATNENLNAKVEFSDVGLSLFKNFPNLSISVDDLTIINNEPFEGDTVISAKTIGVSVDLISAISGDVLQVNSIFLESPKMLFYILEDGRANYYITKEDTTISMDTSKTASQNKFNVSIQNYSIANGKIAFIDQTSNFLVAVNNLNHSGKGDFTQDDLVLDTETSIDELTVSMGGIKYLNGVKAELEMLLGINVPNMKFTFNENLLKVNNLSLKFDGSIAMPNDDIDIDIKYSSPRSEFRDIISLIPTIYKNDFSDLKSSGSMELSGGVKGIYNDDKLPAFNIALNVKDGNFKYPTLPTPINNVNLNMLIENKDGVIDNTIVKMDKIHIELGNEPIDGNFYATKFDSGPIVETQIKGKIDLAKIKNALDLKNISRLEGIINSDFEFKGNLKTASANYESIDAKGKVSVSNIVYEGDSFSQKVNVESGELFFTPKNIQLENFSSKIGESDIQANGSLKNLIAFVISDGVVSGDLNLTSNFFNFNPYMVAEDKGESDKQKSDEEMQAFDIPENVNFKMKAKFKKLLYDNLDLTNVNGEILVKDSKVIMNNLKMNLLNGSLSGNGYYAKNKYQENPDIKFDLDVKDLNIKETYDKFVSISQFAPIAKFIQGSFSSNLSMNTTLDNTMMPIWETFFSNGLLNLKTAEVKGFKPFTTVGSILNLQELSNPKLQNVNPKFEIKNGRFYVKPFNYKIGNYNIVMAGSNGIDQSIDYTMDIEIPAEDLKNKANSAISGLIGKDLNVVKSGTVNVKALIGGTVDNPKVSTSATDVVSNVVEDATKAVVDEAKLQVDKAKEEAEKKIKAEAKKKEEELKKKLEEEAKKKLKKLFKFG